MKRDQDLTLTMALLLALLLEGESHRYKLAGRFQQRFTFLPLETPTAIYGPLARLKQRNLVETRPVKTVSGRRDHRVEYVATEAAPGAHEQWLTLPLRSPLWARRGWRVELLARLATAHKLEIGQLRALIELYQQNALADTQILKRLDAKIPRNLVLSLPDPHERKRLLLARMVLHEQQLTLTAQIHWAQDTLGKTKGGLPK